MRRFLAILSLMLILGGVYTGSAFLAAWEIREAVRTGDTVALTQRVDWPGVRASLKLSAAEARSVLAEMTQASAEVPAKPSLWQRIKNAAAPYLTDPLIERYVTAEGAPKLWTLRETWRNRVRPVVLSEPTTALAGTWLAGSSVDRALSVARRVDRVAFTSPLRMELEIRDRIVEQRRWTAVLELKGTSWTLTKVRVQRTPAGAGTVDAQVKAARARAG